MTTDFPSSQNLLTSAKDRNSVQAYVTTLKMLLHGNRSLWEMTAAQTCCFSSAVLLSHVFLKVLMKILDKMSLSG